MRGPVDADRRVREHPVDWRRHGGADAVQALRAEDFDAVSIQHAHALRVVYTIHGEQRLPNVFLSDFLETLLKQAAGQAKMLEPDRYVLQVGELHEMRFEVIFLYSLQGHNMSDIFSLHSRSTRPEDYLDDSNKRIKVQGRSYTLLSNITFHNRRPNAVISHDLQTKLSGVLRIDRVGIQQCVLVEGRVRGANPAPLPETGLCARQRHHVLPRRADLPCARRLAGQPG